HRVRRQAHLRGRDLCFTPIASTGTEGTQAGHGLAQRQSPRPRGALAMAVRYAVTVSPYAEPAVLRIPIAGVARAPRPGRSEPCPRCGSLGFTVHQRSWKHVKDPDVTRVPVDRYRCKRCGWVGRSYPAGIGPGRQSIAQQQITVVLCAAGLSYSTARLALIS